MPRLALVSSLCLAFVAAAAPPARTQENAAICKDEGTPPDAAIAACSKIISVSKAKTNDLASTYYNRAIAYRQRNELDNALSDYSDAIKINPKHAEQHRLRLIVQRVRGQNVHRIVPMRLLRQQAIARIARRFLDAGLGLVAFPAQRDMVAPEALPTPWIGGGGTTSTLASVTSCIAAFMPTNSERRSCPLPRWLHGLSVT